jgi:hypothetical protein
VWNASIAVAAVLLFTTFGYISIRWRRASSASREAIRGGILLSGRSKYGDALFCSKVSSLLLPRSP